MRAYFNQMSQLLHQVHIPPPFFYPPNLSQPFMAVPKASLFGQEVAYAINISPYLTVSFNYFNLCRKLAFWQNSARSFQIFQLPRWSQLWALITISDWLLITQCPKPKVGRVETLTDQIPFSRERLPMLIDVVTIQSV